MPRPRQHQLAGVEPDLGCAGAQQSQPLGGPVVVVVVLGGQGGLGFLSLPQLLAVAVLGGTATVFFRPARVELPPLIVPDERLEAANARLFGTESAAQVAGPGWPG